MSDGNLEDKIALMLCKMLPDISAETFHGCERISQPPSALAMALSTPNSSQLMLRSLALCAPVFPKATF